MSNQTSSSVQIDAPRDVVFQVISDVKNYPQWATGLAAADVLEADDEGRVRTARFSIDSGPIKDDYTLQYTWPEDSAADPVTVSWDLVDGRTLKSMDGSYELTEVGPETTEVTYHLTVALSVPLPGIMKRKAEKAIVKAALDGLKNHVEGGS